MVAFLENFGNLWLMPVALGHPLKPLSCSRWSVAQLVLVPKGGTRISICHRFQCRSLHCHGNLQCNKRCEIGSVKALVAAEGAHCKHRAHGSPVPKRLWFRLTSFEW